MPSTGSLERLRASNARAVTGMLAAEGSMSRAELARRTGLSRATISSLVADLIAGGLVTESEVRGRPHKGGSGRPPVLVQLSAPYGAVAGIDVGHRHVRVVVADRTGSVLDEDVGELDVDTHGPATLDLAAAMVRDGLRRARLGREELQSVGMCVPGPLDRRSARVGTSILPGWRDLVPAEELARRIDAPVHVDNDANLAALAELSHGVVRGYADVLFVKLASGLGAGVVLGGRLHRGSTGMAGEIGHVQVDEAGRVCRCGSRGCLETMVSVPRLLAVLQPAYDEVLDVDRVLGLERDGDAGVRRVLDDAGRAVGRALADLTNTLNPEAVVLGGALGGSAAVQHGVRAAIDRYAQPEAAAAVEVLAAQLGDRAGVVGAVALAINRVAHV